MEEGKLQARKSLKLTPMTSNQKSFRFWVSGTPKGQPRPRAFAFAGRARVYDPGTAEHWKSQIAIAAREAGLTKFEGSIRVSITLHFQRPKSHFNKGGLKPAAPARWHTQKPDADNAAKAVLDALTTLGAWHDDSQVAALHVVKICALDGGAEITIEEVTE